MFLLDLVRAQGSASLSSEIHATCSREKQKLVIVEMPLDFPPIFETWQIGLLGRLLARLSAVNIAHRRVITQVSLGPERNR
jgi:hypothetical protein